MNKHRCKHPSLPAWQKAKHEQHKHEQHKNMLRQAPFHRTTKHGSITLLPPALITMQATEATKNPLLCEPHSLYHKRCHLHKRSQWSSLKCHRKRFHQPSQASSNHASRETQTNAKALAPTILTGELNLTVTAAPTVLPRATRRRRSHWTR